MYDFCSYHIIDNYIPPTLEAEKELQDSLLRLESISACAIVRDTTNNCKILSQVPRHLHTVIWKAYLRDEYYNSDRGCRSEPVLPHLSELVYHWPEKEFNIKNIMPSFPAKRSWFIPSWHYSELSPLFHIQNYLKQFYNSITYTILENFTKSKSNNNFETHTYENITRTLNISGFSTIGLKKIFDLIKPCKDPFGNDAGDLEVILDAKLDIEDAALAYESDSDSNEEFDSDTEGSEDNNIIITDTEDIEDDIPMAIASYYANLSNSIVRYGHLSLYGNLGCLTGGLSVLTEQLMGYSMPQFHRTEYAIEVIEKSLKKGTESVRIGMNIDISKLIKDVFETTTDKINLKSFELKVEVDSINFLTNFNNLEHLTLNSSKLHGKLKPLLKLKKGLIFLELSDCSLNNFDLGVLLRSCHRSSLLELNLSGNRFSKNSTNLIKLCQELPNLIKLDLQFCRLEKLQDNDLRLLCDSIKSLPNLSYLNLMGNEFSMDTIRSNLTSLSASPSLRFLKLSISTLKLRGNWKKKEAAMEAFSLLINSTMNKERLQLLYVEITRVMFGGQAASFCCICKSEVD